jgi:hypothetical protein
MIHSSKIKSNYSSNVELYLIVGKESWELAAIGPDSIRLRQDGIDLDPCEGEVVMIVDGKERRWDVVLKHGAVPYETTIAISDPEATDAN